MRYEKAKLSYNSPEKSEVKAVVEQYRKAREKGEDGIAYTTQPYWYANKLSSRVMADHGVHLREEYSLMSRQEKDYTISVGDGNFKRIQYHSPICRKKVYYRGDKQVLTVREHLQEKYILADTRYENSKMRYCESCGALMGVTRAYGGCPQCGSAIRIREVHKKIVTIDREISGGWYQKRFILGVFVIMLVYGYILGTIGMIQDGYFEDGFFWGAVFYLLLTTTMPVALMSVWMGAIFGNLLFVPIIVSLN
ncbi:MAG: hypothetical protein K2I53_13700, partial [Lachnospiraceae bacterium]|nr:hypothetical protein [Lachnospiraceae bacterium]